MDEEEDDEGELTNQEFNIYIKDKDEDWGDEEENGKKIAASMKTSSILT